ncbi:MAG TPA: ABC transporter ATP-binding protein [Jiangellaceae bacterium]|jgi:ABC-2 type transport system ATP-binding protein|nr:ABC transporter ATP-binding protein [Jiangellaceae bacterium]
MVKSLDDSRPGSVPAYTSPAIRVEGLRVVRGHRVVLHDFNLSVEHGTLTGLLGPSGSGKTTLMRAIVGVQQIAAGQVEVLGMPAGSEPVRHQIGYLTQSPSVYNDLTVRQNLRYFAAVLGTGRDAVERAIDQVDLGSHADDLVAKLSGGEVSRVSLAVALLGEPEVLVLDEPTVGLDPVLRRDLWNLFNDLARTGVTLLVSSHVMDEAERCGRLLLLREGALLADDTPAGLLEHTSTAGTEQAFLQLIDQEAGR